jgi:ketosteroid isomerase-like protein
MSQEARNVALLRHAYQRWHDSKGGSIDEWLELVADDCAFCSLAEGAPGAEFTCRRRSKDEVRGYLEGLTGEWEMIRYVVDDYVAQGGKVVAIGHTAWRNKRTGRECDSPKLDVWHFQDGKAVSFAEYYDTAKMFAAAS